MTAHKFVRWIPTFALAIALISPPPCTTAGDDAQIRGWVEGAIVHDSRVDAKDIKVTSHDGIVTLSGTVPTLAAASLAVRESQKIRGVMQSIMN